MAERSDVIICLNEGANLPKKLQKPKTAFDTLKNDNKILKESIYSLALKLNKSDLEQLRYNLRFLSNAHFLDEIPEPSQPTAPAKVPDASTNGHDQRREKREPPTDPPSAKRQKLTDEKEAFTYKEIRSDDRSPPGRSPPGLSLRRSHSPDRWEHRRSPPQYPRPPSPRNRHNSKVIEPLRVCVRNWPRSSPQQELESFFQAAGPLLSVTRVLRPGPYDSTVNYFFSLSSQESVNTVFKRDGEHYKGNKISVLPALTNPGQAPAPEPAERPQVHVTNLPHDVTPAELREVFAHCGEIRDLHLPSKFPGTAFIEFRDGDAVRLAVERDRQVKIADLLMHVEVVRTKR